MLNSCNPFVRFPAYMTLMWVDAVAATAIANLELAKVASINYQRAFGQLQRQDPVVIRSCEGGADSSNVVRLQTAA